MLDQLHCPPRISGRCGRHDIRVAGHGGAMQLRARPGCLLGTSAPGAFRGDLALMASKTFAPGSVAKTFARGSVAKTFARGSVAKTFAPGNVALPNLVRGHRRFGHVHSPTALNLAWATSASAAQSARTRSRRAWLNSVSTCDARASSPASIRRDAARTTSGNCAGCAPRWPASASRLRPESGLVSGKRDASAA